MFLTKGLYYVVLFDLVLSLGCTHQDFRGTKDDGRKMYRGRKGNKVVSHEGRCLPTNKLSITVGTLHKVFENNKKIYILFRMCVGVQFFSKLKRDVFSGQLCNIYWRTVHFILSTIHTLLQMQF